VITTVQLESFRVLITLHRQLFPYQECNNHPPNTCQRKFSPMGFLAVKDFLESFHMACKLFHKLGIARKAGEGEDIQPNVICNPVRGRVG